MTGPSDDLVLTRYTDPRAFSAVVSPAMTGDDVATEAANCLQLGLLSDMLAGRILDPYLATVALSDSPAEPLLSVMQTPPYRLILGDPSAAAPGLERLLEPLFQALPADLPGVLGPVEVTAYFAERYAELHGVNHELVMSERVHLCHRVTMPQRVPGRLRRATPADEALLVRWWRAFQLEAVPNEPDRAEASVKRDLYAEVGGLWVWEVEGEPVALAGARGPTPRGMRVGPVYTPPEKRRNGYAAALVGSLTQLLIQQGREFVFLFTDLANPTSNALYARLGYVGVADRSMYDFTPNPPTR